MRCIIQIFTGNRDERLYSAEEIVARLETVTAMVTVSKVIIGWHPDKALYRTVGEYLRKKRIDMLLWLPVFAEADAFVSMTAAVDVWGRLIPPPAVQEGEAFSFCCPTSDGNLDAVQRIYDTCFADCGFAGVFLDRIRTQSFVGGVEGVLSCGCDSCRKNGIPAKDAAEAYRLVGDRFFDKDENGFVHPVARRFFEAKADAITRSVKRLSDRFHAKGLQVGLDLYAPFMSGFVGQDYQKLARCADFIKPMLYRRTEAPAGMGYEYRLFRQCVPTAKGYPAVTADSAFLRSQLAALKDLPCEVFVGLEINRLDDIARTDTAYVTESMTVIKDSGVSGVTLSWNIMEAPDEHIKAAACPVSI